MKSYVYDGIKAVDPDKLWDAENSEWRLKKDTAQTFLDSCEDYFIDHEW